MSGIRDLPPHLRHLDCVAQKIAEQCDRRDFEFRLQCFTRAVRKRTSVAGVFLSETELEDIVDHLRALGLTFGSN